MKRLGLVAGVAAVVALLMGAVPASALTQGALGADVSYPQCSGTSFTGSPSGATFGIVGVNNGRPGAANPCLTAEFGWAQTRTAQSPQLYVNTADPGNSVADWPKTSPTNPYGTCTSVKSRGQMIGANSTACAYQYGVMQAGNDVTFAGNAGVNTSMWWLDVETANSWLSRSLIGLNQAVLLGMVDTFHGHGATVGAYSTHYQWNKIVGPLDTTAGPTLNTLAEWIPGASDQPTATADCTNGALPTFTNGHLTYIQYTGTYDFDVAC